MPPSTPRPSLPLRILNVIEVLGNKLPTPTTLFIIFSILILPISYIGHSLGWEVTAVEPRAVMGSDGKPVINPSTGRPKVELAVQNVVEVRPVRDEDGHPVLDANDRLKTESVVTDQPRVITARSLLSADGIYHIASRLVFNFINFAPLGIVISVLLGVAVAEKTGLIAALLRSVGPLVPKPLVTPALVFLGTTSSVASDSGYVVLPPLAAALFISAGRAPLAGIAAVFAGIAGGFSANIFLTGIDPVMSSLSTAAAHTIEPGYTVQPTATWFFAASSGLILSLAGWAVTAWITEPRLSRDPDTSGTGIAQPPDPLTSAEKRGIMLGGLAMLAILGLFLASIFIPGWPLHGTGPSAPRADGRIDTVDRWSVAIVPTMFLIFLIPGVLYGLATGTVKGEKDVMKMMGQSIGEVAPMIVLAFFAGQFIDFLKYSRFDQMTAMTGGKLLASLDMHWSLLIVLFILLTVALDFLVSSMSAKYTMMAPIFVPMFMLIGLAPELTQAAYRVADSVVNMITPLNAYLIIILAVIQKYRPQAGIGTILSLMIPYSITFTIVWTIWLLIWVGMGFPLGIDSRLWYHPTQAP
ncbi:MAG: AbgT family transporter [Phycisphaerales bacterium]|nr:AbgT family transporter [Phycisphaerales bacterium]